MGTLHFEWVDFDGVHFDGYILTVNLNGYILTEDILTKYILTNILTGSPYLHFYSSVFKKYDDICYHLNFDIKNKINKNYLKKINHNKIKNTANEESKYVTDCILTCTEAEKIIFEKYIFLHFS